MIIVEKKISEINPYEKNPRFNDNAVKKVANSIKDFGFKVPIIIDKNGVIVCGHTRYEAAKLLELKTVPCTIIDNLTDKQIKLFRIVDNKSGEYASWDDEKLDEELEKIINLNMADYGFLDIEFDWDGFDEISEENYEQPEKKVCECPYCHHIDSKNHFKKVDKSEVNLEDVELE